MAKSSMFNHTSFSSEGMQEIISIQSWLCISALKNERKVLENFENLGNMNLKTSCTN